MEDKEPKQRIYDDLGLESAGISYESFSKKFDSNPEVRKSVYKDLGLEQAGVDYQTFETKMFGQKKNSIGSDASTGGKAGALETPSIGSSSYQEALGIKKPTAPTPLVTPFQQKAIKPVAQKDESLRPDGTKKDIGFLGEFKTPSGKSVSEYSIGVPINGKEMDIPTLVPTLTEEEKKYIIDKAEKEEQIGRDAIGNSIVKKSIAHAEQRIKEGKSPFFSSSEKTSPFLQKAKERAEQGAPTVLSVKKETIKEVGLPSYTPTKEEELKAPTQKQFEQQALLPTYQKESALDISKKQTQVATERLKALDELIKTKKEAQSSYEKIRNLDKQIESFEPQFEKFKTTAEAFQPDIQEYKNLTSKIAEIKNKSNSFVLEYNNEYQKLAPKLEAYKQIFENEKLPNEKRQDAYENYNGIVSILKNKEKLLDQAVAQNEQGIGDLEARAKSFDETIKKATANQAGFSQLYSQYKSLIDERNKSAEGLGVYEKRMSDAQNQIKQKLFEQSQLEDVRQQKLEKEYSTWQNLIESLPKMGIEAVAGVSDMLNVLGFSGDPESPETRDEVKKETRQNIEKLRKFGDSFITQELPKNYEKFFEGQFSLKKLANVGFNAIASTAPTIAAGLIGGPAAGVAAGAGMAFGESKEIMKEAGLTEEQAEAAAFGLSFPIGLLDNYGAEDFVKLFSKEAVEYSTKIFLKNIAGRTLTKEQLFNEAKNTIGQIIKDGAPQLLKEGVKESGTEVSQGTVNEVAKQVAQEFTGVDLDENMSWSDYLKNQAEVRGEEAIGGFIGGTSMQTIGLGIKSAGEGIFPTFNPSAYQKALELLDPSKMEAFSQEVQQEVQDKVLTQEQADLAFRNIQLIQETNKLIPATINNKDLRTEALNLLIEKKETQKEIEGKDDALVAPQKARIEEINKRLSNIANGKEEEVVTPTVKLNKNTTPTEEKYGTIDRGDGKGVVDLTRAEYEAELAKQGGEVKPMVTEVQFATKQRERRDQEIEEVQQLRNDLGQDVELINDIPGFVDDVVDRMDLGMMVAPEMLSDAIKELDKQFDKLQAYRNDPARTHTTAQIDAMIDVLGAVKSEIQDYQIKQQENEQQQPTTATQAEPTVAPTEGVEAGQEQVTPTTEEEKGKSSVPSKTDKAYQEAQGVTERVSKAHPEASVLVLPKGNDLSLTALYVGKEKRGKGIGSGVLESVKAEADKLGKKVVLDATNELDNDTDLERLGEFYERNGFVKVGENKFEYTPKKNQLLTPNINQNETVNENVREIGNGQKDGQKGDVSQEAKSDVQEGEEKVAEGEEPTAEQVDKASKAVGTTPSNLRDLYRVNRDLFGQNRVRAFASAIAMDRMIGAMAKRAGISKQRMYEKLQFRKASEEELPQGVKFQLDAWHGSPYQFDRFTTLKIGTGEGAQAFGWGLYFTDLESIAKGYADKLSDTNIDRLSIGLLDLVKEGRWVGYDVAKTETEKRLVEHFAIYENEITDAYRQGKDVNKAVLSLLQDFIDGEKQELKSASNKFSTRESDVEYYKNAIKEAERLKGKIIKADIKSSRNLYKVTLHKGKTPDQYTWLEWDKPIEKESLLNSVLSEIRKIDEKPNSLRDFQRELSAAQDDNYYKQNLLKYSGKDFYIRLSESIGQKEASLLLLRAGIDGVKYPAESIARGATSDNARGFNYVVFDENAVSIEEVIKFQKDAEKARGAMMMALDGQAIIYALSDPNVSTPLHEMAHVFEHYLTESERQTIIRNAGTGAWTTETSEYFARGFEKYLAEGVAPTKELQKVFEKFKEWLTEIYNGITGSEIDIQLNDEMRAIYAQMFGEEEVNSKFKPNETTQKENGQPLPEGVSGVRTETEERKTSPELRPQEEEVRSIIDNAVANFYAINEATKRSEKREAAKEYRQNLEKMPTVKNIFDNIKTIFAQLEAEGVITKSKDCP